MSNYNGKILTNQFKNRFLGDNCFDETPETKHAPKSNFPI